MKSRLTVAAIVCSVIINVEANMAAGTRRINTSILSTNRKLPSSHSKSVPTYRSKAIALSIALSIAQKKCRKQFK